jgi:hypothetical protein
MSQSFADRLSQFTPDGAGLDRDSLLFAAGRASVRLPRRWPALCGVLAAAQVLTLVLLWPRSPGLPDPPSGDALPVAAEQQPEPARGSGSTLAELRGRALGTEAPLQATQSITDIVPSDPPLHALGAPPPALLH